MTNTRLPLPKGKLNIRHRQMRGMWQAFAGNTYIGGASGDDVDEAAQQLANQYEVEAGTPIVVHGYREPHTVLTPEPTEAIFAPTRTNY